MVMVKPTPARFNPDTMARDGTQYSVKLPLTQFTRLQALLSDTDGSMEARFRFSRREDYINVAGTVSARFPLVCQRCLEPMVVTIDEPFEFVFVDTELAAQRLAAELDPVVLDDSGQIHVTDLFEDELLLHLPVVSKHPNSETCVAGDREFGQIAEAENRDRRRPFDVLKNLEFK